MVTAAAARDGAGGREFLVATDARRREVYWARYSPAGQRTAGPLVSRPADLPRGPMVVTGQSRRQMASRSRPGAAG